MNLIYALVFIFCISLISCKSINYINVDTNEDIFNDQSSPSEKDDQKVFSHKLRFLKILPLNKGLKNIIDDQTLELETKNKNSVPFAIIVSTPDSNLDQLKNSKLNSTLLEFEDLTTIGDEPEDMFKIREEEDKSDLESQNIHDDDNKSEMTLKNVEENSEEVLFPINIKSNTGEDDHSDVNNELIFKKPQIKDDLSLDNQLQNMIMIQGKDGEMRGFITDMSKAKLEIEESLHHKEEVESRNALPEVKNDPEDATVINPVFLTKTNCKQSDCCYQRNVKEDDLESVPITYVLNKYVFVK